MEQSLQTRGIFNSLSANEKDKKPSVIMQSIETSVDELSGFIAETFDE